MIIGALLATSISVVPIDLTTRQEKVAAQVVRIALDEGEDPYTLLAVSWVETKLDASVVSRVGDVGLMQVNCNLWKKELGFVSYKECRKMLLYVDRNVRAALHIIRQMRSHKQCEGDGIYSCFNGGPNWSRGVWAGAAREYGRRARAAASSFKRFHGTLVDDSQPDIVQGGEGLELGLTQRGDRTCRTSRTSTTTMIAA